MNMETNSKMLMLLKNGPAYGCIRKVEILVFPTPFLKVYIILTIIVALLMALTPAFVHGTINMFMM